MRIARLLLVLLPPLLVGGCGDDAAKPFPGYDANGRPLAPVARPADPPNLVVMVIDSLRHDAFEPRGTDGGSSPDGIPMRQVASWVEGSVDFTEATADATWTLPSATSILTGLMPSEHGLVTQIEGQRLLSQITTFAEVLSAGFDYDTAAFVDGPWYEGEGQTLLQGFRSISESFSLRGMAGDVDRWARFRDPTKPFFLFFHTYEVHAPYGSGNHPWPTQKLSGGVLTEERVRALSPRDQYRIMDLRREAIQDVDAVLGGDEAMARYRRYAYEGFAEHPDPALAQELSDAYWEGVRWADAIVRDAIDSLQARGLLQNTLLVLTSDHGESFGEHGRLGHGLQLHDEIARVPLAMRGPPPFDEPRRVTSAVALVDVLPTFLDLAKIPALPGIEGRSVIPVVEGRATRPPVLLEERLGPDNTGTQVQALLLGARTASWKYELRFDRSTATVKESAWDLVQDPGETRDLADAEGRVSNVPFDEAMCRAVQQIRGRIWRDDAASGPGTYAAPYAARPGRPSSAPPPPCRGGHP